MSFPVRFTEEAERDLLEAAKWFSNQVSVNLANRLVDLVETTTKKIAENPEHYAIVYKSYRQCVVRPFSYIVTYRIKNQGVEILAITHSSRHPKVWKQR